MRNPRQSRCGAAIFADRRSQADEALGTKPEFEPSDFSRRNQRLAAATHVRFSWHGP
jgi:hypothetical protein